MSRRASEGQWSRVKGPRYKTFGLNNWAQRWRDLVYGPPGPWGEERRRPTSVWPVIVALVALAGLCLAGGYVGVVTLAQLNANPYVVEEGDILLPARSDYDAERELQAAVDELKADPQGAAASAPLRQNSRASRQPANPGPAKGCFGTSIEFVEDLEAAAKMAEQSGKLLLILNVSGHFEDSPFT